MPLANMNPSDIAWGRFNLVFIFSLFVSLLVNSMIFEIFYALPINLGVYVGVLATYNYLVGGKDPLVKVQHVLHSSLYPYIRF